MVATDRCSRVKQRQHLRVLKTGLLIHSNESTSPRFMFCGRGIEHPSGAHSLIPNENLELQSAVSRKRLRILTSTWEQLLIPHRSVITKKYVQKYWKWVLKVISSNVLTKIASTINILYRRWLYARQYNIPDYTSKYIQKVYATRIQIQIQCPF